MVDDHRINERVRLLTHRINAEQIEMDQQLVCKADPPEGRLLRSNGPFSILIGVGDVNARGALWRKARQDVLRIDQAKTATTISTIQLSGVSRSRHRGIRMPRTSRQAGSRSKRFDVASPSSQPIGVEMR